jgi:transcriptional antiterminator NusG
MKWYIAKCPTGAEHNAIKEFRELLMKTHQSEMFEEYCVPYEKSHKRTSNRSNMANYVFIRMDLVQSVQSLFSKLETMNLMLDENLDPVVISDEEVAIMKAKLEEALIQKAHVFEVGETVRVLEAPFEDFTATIEKVDEAKEIASVSVPILGRHISVELPFKSIKRITD